MSSIGNLKSGLKRAALGTVFGGSLLVAAGSGVAQSEPAPPPPGPDGLVNVVVGEATYLDSVPVAQAVQAVTEMCALPAPAVSAIAAEVDAAGVNQTACAAQSGDNVVLAQNLPPADEPSPAVPGTSAEIGSEPEAGAEEEEEAPSEPITDSLPDEPNNIPGMN
ncbi:MAG: hypothetical protein ABWY45_12265 [Mycobacterium sp.]